MTHANSRVAVLVAERKRRGSRISQPRRRDGGEDTVPRRLSPASHEALLRARRWCDRSVFGQCF